MCISRCGKDIKNSCFHFSMITRVCLEIRAVSVQDGEKTQPEEGHQGGKVNKKTKREVAR